MIIDLQIIIVGCFVAMSASILGVFLILRKQAMMTDAISHCVLLGIVIMFFILRSLHSPLLILGAMITGFFVVLLIEYIRRRHNVRQDAAIGLVFSFCFALALLLINMFASDIHLDQDAVLLGEIGFVPLHRLVAFGRDLGPLALWSMGAIMCVNGLFVFLFYKELVCTVFDKALAFNLGLKPRLIYYGLMLCVSLTTVGAFDAVGSILIIALMVAPPATAYLITTQLKPMLMWSCCIGCVNAIAGYYVAVLCDGNIAGAMCLVAGFQFIMALLFAQEHGLLIKFYTYRQQQLNFSAILLTIQLMDHEHTQKVAFENSLKNLIVHMKWTPSFSLKVIEYARSKQWITSDKTIYTLTDLGREIAKQAIIN